MGNNKTLKNVDEEKTLMNFLNKTKEGQFARVDDVPSPFIRFKIRQEETAAEVEDEEQYYYSIH